MLLTDITQSVDTIRYSGFVVLPEYIDPNGHMNVGYYSVLFDKALDLPWDVLGLGSGSTEATGVSSFTLESHVTYQHEVHEGDPLDFTFQLINFDAKRIHFFMTMLHAKERWLAATSESISMCIDMTTRRNDLARRQAGARASPARSAFAAPATGGSRSRHRHTP
ncbi:MAG: thioesterase family protein, partial [Betaproteobacteria bacterium]